MLTDDGKHLYVSWDEYHMLIERLALRGQRPGWDLRPDPVPGARRSAARRRLSRVFDKPLGIMSTSSYRADAGTIQGRLDIAKYITPPGRARRARAGCSTTSPTPASRSRRWSSGCAACRRSASCARPSSGPRACRRRPTTSSNAADEPVDPPALRGGDGLRPEGLAKKLRSESSSRSAGDCSGHLRRPHTPALCKWSREPPRPEGFGLTSGTSPSPQDSSVQTWCPGRDSVESPK